MKTFETLSEAIQHLIDPGYTVNRNIHTGRLLSDESNYHLHPVDEFEIDERHRFQEISDVDNETILYAISSRTRNLKEPLVTLSALMPIPSAVNCCKTLLINSITQIA